MSMPLQMGKLRHGAMSGGSVTAPSLHFDLAELDFGDISFGFPYTQCCRLTNSSAVPLTFQLRMSDDGTQPAVDSVDQIRRDTDPAWSKGIHFHVEPREFTINPSQGTILPQGHQDIEVTLCSNTVMEFYRRLLVDLEGIGKGVAALIITARCLVPELQVSSPVLLCDECHLKVPYERKILIRNPSHLPGCYGLIPQRAQLRSSGRLAEISPSPRLAELGRIPAPQPVDELHPPKFKPQPPKERRTSLESPASRWRHFRTGKAFSILPLPGVLQPGESQQVSSTFSGNLTTTCNVPELCHMEGGSTYKVLVPRAASRVSSSLSPQEINCGSQAPLRDRRELKEPAQKVKEEAKALEEEERRKEEERQKKGKKSVSVGKQPPIPAKGKTKTRENKETKIPKKETKIPERKEIKIPEKKESKASEGKKMKASEKKDTKASERKETKIPEKKEAKISEKKEAKDPKKGEPKAIKKGGTEIPKD
ncbi:hydrocephalus-inducing protein-like isoform X3 [Zonotrichia leucophrys gambelii]|uniref:hydrocephalus-inducing protein-like isoform X3 n=1 Tax=Zonotrichia leucophrys gambelii TaxID=257770 RepID=UPI0031402DEB